MKKILNVLIFFCLLLVAGCSSSTVSPYWNEINRSMTRSYSLNKEEVTTNLKAILSKKGFSIEEHNDKGLLTASLKTNPEKYPYSELILDFKINKISNNLSSITLEPKFSKRIIILNKDKFSPSEEIDIYDGILNELK